jgi:hypothetical protein
MKVECYKCDVCGKIQVPEYMTGFKGIEDLFSTFKSFPAEYDLTKTDYHFCLECYRQQVIIPAEAVVNKARDREGYQVKVEELFYLLKSQIVMERRKNVKKVVK